MELFRQLYHEGKIDFADRGLSVKTIIARYASDLAPARWGEVCVELHKDVGLHECAYVVQFVFGGMQRGWRSPRLQFSVTLAMVAITGE